ncbi:MAG: hypothetical protein NTZ59_15550, partial [Bacteroidetes bacterium]|nr:hypothetical protein [Bacteroidota bacterium]
MKQQKPKHLVAIIIAMLFSFSAFSQDGYIYPYNAKACQFSTNDSMVFAVTSTVVDAVRYTFKYRLDGSSPLTITTDSLATQVKLPINTSTITTHIYILDSIKADTGKYMASTYPVAWTTRNVEIGTASSYTGTVNINTCSDRLPFNWGDKLVTGSGTYSTILKNSYQCDSFATITFAFNYSDTITSKDSVCFSQFPYLKFGINYNNVGTYYQRTLNDNASYFSFPDTATMNIQIVNLYKYLYAHNPLTMNLINGSGHANFGQKAFDIVNDLMGND